MVAYFLSIQYKHHPEISEVYRCVLYCPNAFELIALLFGFSCMYLFEITPIYLYLGLLSNTLQ